MSTPLTRPDSEGAPPQVRARHGATDSILSDPEGSDPADLAQLLEHLLTTPGASSKQQFTDEKAAPTTLAWQAFSNLLRASGMQILELIRDSHLLGLNIRERGCLTQFELDAIYMELQRVEMKQNDTVRDVADRIIRKSAQLIM
jgi:hypothetical protein